MADIQDVMETGKPDYELLKDHGPVVRAPAAILIPAEVEGTAGTMGTPPQSVGTAETIPIVEETLEIGRRTVVTGTVRLRKVVQAYDEQLDEPLSINTFDIERVILNREVDATPAVRHEGDTTIYPVIEEQLVLTKRLVLKEEVRVTRRQSERRDTRVVTLHREAVVVEREAISETAGTNP